MEASVGDSMSAKTDFAGVEVGYDIPALPGMDEATAFALAQHKIVTSENLADLATDELMELAIDGMDESRAAGLIMAAREAKAA